MASYISQYYIVIDLRLSSTNKKNPENPTKKTIYTTEKTTENNSNSTNQNLNDNDTWIEKVLSSGNIFQSGHSNLLHLGFNIKNKTNNNSDNNDNNDNNNQNKLLNWKYKSIPLRFFSNLSDPSTDYRFGEISIIPLDMKESSSFECDNKKNKSSSFSLSSESNCKSTLSPFSLYENKTPIGVNTGSLAFVKLRAHFLGEGVLQLYRSVDNLDYNQTKNSLKNEFQTNLNNSGLHLESGNKNQNNTKNKNKHKNKNKIKIKIKDKDKDNKNVQDINFDENSDNNCIVAILAVPSYMSICDFVGYIGEKNLSSISHFRFIRTPAPNRYMALMKFKNNLLAFNFRNEFDGKLFNSMEPETCQAVFIKSIIFLCNKQDSLQFPYLDEYDDKNINNNNSNNNNDKNKSDNNKNLTIVNSITKTQKPAPPPTPSLHELPTCPVCLERMDSNVTGLVTIICQHTFHCECLTKWGDNSCPICRYSHKRDVVNYNSNNNNNNDNSQEENELFCKVCGCLENLWVCLICGFIGCGRYNQKHAFDHYMETKHSYSMGIDSQRIWDYASDGYVHRLLQDRVDGKLVELPSISDDFPNIDNSNTSSSMDIPSKEKYNNIIQEYTNLLTSQLDSQRIYYEDKITAAADKAAKAIEKSTQACKEKEEIAKKYSNLLNENNELFESVKTMKVELSNAINKINNLNKISQSFQKEWKEEKSLNDNMVKRLEHMTEQKDKHESEISELKEQIRDLMFYLDAKDTLQNESEDVKQGSVTVAAPSKKNKSRKR